MQTPEYRGLIEVSRETGIPFYRILYAENAGWLPPPMRIANKRVYQRADIDRIRQHFADKEKHEQARNAVRAAQGITSGQGTEGVPALAR